MNNKKKDYLGFYYPKFVGEWSWDWPFNTYGGWKTWLWHKHESINEDNSNKWTLEVRFGFKRVTREWLVSPLKAYMAWKLGQKRLVEHLLDLVYSPEKYGLDKEDDVEETRLFK